jgi:hypothetical protein
MEMSFFGVPLYILDMCPKNRDESNGNSIIKLWVQFIPIFGALHWHLRKGHTTKKTSPCSFAFSFSEAYDTGTTLQGYRWKKLYLEHGDVFFVVCP